MIVDNLPLVGYLVAEVCGSANNLPRDDLAAAGAIALVEVVDSYDPTRGIPFGYYARERLIGAIRDEMRRGDWPKRAQRKQIRETASVQESLTNALGRSPSVVEVAGALGVSREAAAEGISYASRTVAALDTTADYIASDTMLPEAALLVAERMGYLRVAVDALPERMKLIIEEVYFAERSVVDVAAELGVTHGAISQQRSEAVRLLREGLNAHYEMSSNQPGTLNTNVTPARRNAYLTSIASKIGAGVELMPAVAYHA
jgi:RNA polymerase sigma factor for flagellar operon FliA